VTSNRSRQVLRYSLAIMLAVRCGSEDGVKQLLARVYNAMDEQQIKSIMLRLIYLLSAKERDWLRNLV
jgi:uncharacterized protein (UPF0297 family)